LNATLINSTALVGWLSRGMMEGRKALFDEQSFLSALPPSSFLSLSFVLSQRIKKKSSFSF